MSVVNSINGGSTCTKTAGSSYNKNNNKATSTSSTYKIQDAILMGWLIENLQLLGLAALFLTIGPLKDCADQDATYLSMFFKAWIGIVMMSLTVNELLRWNVEYVYSHIPFYNLNKKPEPIDVFPHRLVQDIIEMGVAAIFFAALPQIGYIPAQSASTGEVVILSNGFLGGIFHLLMARLSMDVIFRAAHQFLLHYPQSWWYTNCHKIHHQHHWPRLDTNYYFHFVDRFLEGPTSVIFGLIMGSLATKLAFNGREPSIYEVSYCFAMLAHNLFASHAGKHLPSCSFFPPLSILYRPLLLLLVAKKGAAKPIVDHNIHHHFIHHEKASCNFGINSWTDYVMGTRYNDVFLKAEKQK